MGACGEKTMAGSERWLLRRGVPADAPALAGLVAYAQVRRHTPPPCVTHSRPVELRRFYVDRPAQGRGLAQRLMTEVLKEARGLGGEHLWLCVWEHNPRAQAFYARQGFVDVGQVDFMVGPDRQNDRVLVAPL